MLRDGNYQEADIKLPDLDLAYFVAGTPEFAAYWRDLQWAQNYARFNRDVMMERFKPIVEKHLAGGKPTKPLMSVNCHHNYAEKEVHFGNDRLSICFGNYMFIILIINRYDKSKVQSSELVV